MGLNCTTYPHEISDERRDKHGVQFDVIVFENVLEASASAVFGDDAHVGRVHAGPDEGTQVVVAQVPQLR